MENYNIIIVNDYDYLYTFKKHSLLINGTKEQFIKELKSIMLELSIKDGTVISYENMFLNELKFFLFEVENNIVYELDSEYWYKYIYEDLKKENKL